MGKDECYPVLENHAESLRAKEIGTAVAGATLRVGGDVRIVVFLLPRDS